MAFTAMGVKRDDQIWRCLPDRVENGAASPERPASLAGPELPFLAFARDVQPQTGLRATITAAYRRPEEDCVPALIVGATLPADRAASGTEHCPGAGSKAAGEAATGRRAGPDARICAVRR